MEPSPAVSITKRKLELYREALDHGCSAQEAGLFPVGVSDGPILTKAASACRS